MTPGEHYEVAEAMLRDASSALSQLAVNVNQRDFDFTNTVELTAQMVTATIALAQAHATLATVKG